MPLTRIGETGTFFLLVLLSSAGCASKRAGSRGGRSAVGEPSRRLARLEVRTGGARLAIDARRAPWRRSESRVRGGSGQAALGRRAGPPGAGQRGGRPHRASRCSGWRASRFEAGTSTLTEELEATARPARRSAPRGERRVLRRDPDPEPRRRRAAPSAPRARTRSAAICTTITACRCTRVGAVAAMRPGAARDDVLEVLPAATEAADRIQVVRAQPKS